MSIRDRYDVVIAGGGLSGLCLAIQLKRQVPGATVLVAEKNAHPPPEAAHKVGESSVEAGSFYFREVLGLADVLEGELPKFGLRFFLSGGGNRDIAQRLECGPSHFLYVPSFQIDRGRFEAELAKRARAAGVDFVDGCRVTLVALAENGGDHAIGLDRSLERIQVRCRWLADASGRAALLKKRLRLERANRHDVNAVWFRIDHPIDLDDWSDDPGWSSRLEHPRRLSTNHLMGEGYWVWLIPLAKDRTSVGIVADERVHPFPGLSSFERALEWLEAHEPQCAGIVRSLEDERMDFRALRNYSHDVKQMFSADRWCLTGDAGLFIDPFYSPGNDFIGMANGFACDLIERDLRGETIDTIASQYDQVFRSLARTYLVNYQRQYPLMGNARVMTTKIVWDFVMYWGSVALLFCQGRLCDLTFMERIRPTLRSFAFSNMRMQAFFREWAAGVRDAGPPSGSFVDYAELGFLAELNRKLCEERDDESLVEQLARNLQLARELGQEILAEGSRAGVRSAQLDGAPNTGHLDPLFAAMSAAGQAEKLWRSREREARVLRF